MKDKELHYQIALNLIPDVGAVLAKRLIAYIGSPEGIFKEKSSNLEKVPGIGKSIIAKMNKNELLSLAEKELKFMDDFQVKSCFFTDIDYPERLKQCEDGPVLFFYKGETDFNKKKIISIVGTREATDYGREFTLNLIREISNRNHNMTIVSGLAYGIDITAHKASLDNNLHTIAVLGHGLGTIYPAVHRNIAADISRNGILFTEFISTDKPDRPRFVRRNRVIAGLSDAIIVVESAKKGGAMITAEMGNSYHRDVFALPGKLTDKYSEGCNYLIKINKAHLIESVDDLEYIMGWDSVAKLPQQMALFPELTEKERKILQVIQSFGEVSIDYLAMECNLKMNELSANLLNLEFKDLVKNLPGKKYKTTIQAKQCI